MTTRILAFVVKKRLKYELLKSYYRCMTTGEVDFRGRKKDTRVSAPDNPNKIQPIVDLAHQSVEVDVKEKLFLLQTIDKEEHIRRSILVADDSLWKYMHSDARSLAETFRRGARISDNGPCLGYRKPMPDGTLPYAWLTYDDVLQRSENLGRGFIEKGLAPGQNTFIGIYSKNRPEWVITEQACYFFSMVTVPLYDTLGPEACSFIINQTEIRVVVCDRSHQAEMLVEKRYTCPSLQSIFPSYDDLATICYTSGTTGNPKGVMITHGNIVSACTGSYLIRFAKQ
uniref:long-chain-fatty-acid--CoA ligase n=1 Tax=Romanomermis culicivorax TaxID=13658 RepID=A0A915HQ86_ROMCU